MALQKPKPGAGTVPGKPVLAHDAEVAGRWPNLWEYLSVASYEDGSPRQTASLTLFVQAGQAKCCLNDKDNQRSLFMSGASFGEILDALDVACVHPIADWRNDRTVTGNSAKKR